jgi:hypothetical protein
MIQLSVLIPTLPESKHYLDRILGDLGTIPEGVELVIDARDRGIPTGTKRNDMIQRAKGTHVVHVDCDDRVDPQYINLILEALKSDPDCVTFCGTYVDVINNNYKQDWTIKLGEKYEARGNHIYRWPNHLAVMRKSLIERVKFPDVWRGEDYTWSKQIAEMGLLKTEVHIPKQLYHYLFISNK